jgi:uncharacterized delta-60 repeat protein
MTFTVADALLAQTVTPGALDTAFIKGPGADGFVRVVAVQPDGKIVLGGNFSTVRGANNALITRLTPDGSSDPGFSSQFLTPVLQSRIYTVGFQINGSIVAAGLFSGVGSIFRTNIARLQADGSVDPTFNPGAGPSGLVRILALQPDGRIIIGGEFTTVNNTNRNRIARLNADGSLDTSFNPGLGADNSVRTVALLPGGQILVGGQFTSFDGHSSKYLVRLNSDGTLDTTFPQGTGPDNSLYFISPQPDGTMIIAGDFTSVNGTNINRIARLQPDGSLDDSFMPPGGAVGGPVYQVIVQLTGKIVVGGAFTSLDGMSFNHLGRLNTDGSLDLAFNPGAGASDMVLSLAMQTDGKLLAGGLFATYDQTPVGMFARIYGEPPYPVLMIQPTGSGQLVISWPASASAYTLQTTAALNPSDWQTVTNTPVLQGDHLTVTLPASQPTQFYRLFAHLNQ